PWPRDSSTPRTTPTTTPGPDRYPANSPGHHWPSPPVNATATATRGTSGHHCRDRHISAGSQLSHHISAGTTRHPRPTPRPPITHHDCASLPPTSARHAPLPLPPHSTTAACLCAPSM
ncbi:hypothetical protein C0993_004538, partial [Termitomyces sp. T159_Od127]